MRSFLAILMAVVCCGAGCKKKVPKGVTDIKIVPANVRAIAVYRSHGVYRSGTKMSKIRFDIYDPKAIRKLASLIDYSRAHPNVECELDAQLFIRLKSADVYVTHLITDGWQYISRSVGGNEPECQRSFRITAEGRRFLKKRAQSW